MKRKKWVNQHNKNTFFPQFYLVNTHSCDLLDQICKKMFTLFVLNDHFLTKKNTDHLNVFNITNNVSVNSLDLRKLIALNIRCLVIDWLFGPNLTYKKKKSSLKSRTVVSWPMVAFHGVDLPRVYWKLYC